MTSSDPYTKLRSFLNQLPLGYPETESGVELKILKKIFSEDEAELAVCLSPVPEEAHQIAERNGIPIEGLAEKLESMSKKGLIFRIRRQGKTLYNTAPFMIGLYEYSVKKMNRELAELCRQYYDEAYQDEMGAGKLRPTKPDWFMPGPIPHTWRISATAAPAAAPQ